MTLFSATDRDRIASAIAEAERDTAGEIVCVVARSASDYRYVPLIWAALVALALPWPLLRFTVLSAERVHLIQLAAFLGLGLVLWLLPWRLALVPGFVKRERARRAAEQQFNAQRVYHTTGRTGCLIYVAEAERFAIVLPDAGIAGRVAPDVWKLTIELLTDALKEDRAADGFIRAIEICGAVLKEHAPAGDLNRNELPNRIILL